jgi:colicin import membrane protein
MNTAFTLNYRQPFLLAIAFHLILLAVILFQMRFSTDTPSAPPETQEIIQATLVEPTTATQPQNTVAPTKLPTEPKKIIEKPTLPKEKPLAKPTQEKASPEKAQPEDPVVTQKITEEALALEKIKQQTQIKKHAEKIAALEKQKQLQTAIKEQVEKEQPEEKAPSHLKQQKTIEELLAQDLAKSSSVKPHKKSVSTEKSASQIDNKEIDRFKGLLIAAISHRWIMPENLKKGLECHLKVRLAPGGVVLSVKLIQSSGEPTLDHSAESAIYKASPLPVPKAANLFGEFREFNLVVRPEGILAE